MRQVSEGNLCWISFSFTQSLSAIATFACFCRTFCPSLKKSEDEMIVEIEQRWSTYSVYFNTGLHLEFSFGAINK